MGKLAGKGKHTLKAANHPHTNMISKPAIVRRGEHKCRKWELHWKVKRIQHHQTSFTTNAKGTSLGRKHKRR